VVQIDLAADSSRITAVRILDMNHPRVAEPRSAWWSAICITTSPTASRAAAQQNSVLADQPLAEPVILKLSLDS